MKESWLSNNIKSILALIIVLVGFAYFYMCSLRDIKPDPQILIAFVSTISLVTGYFYGSSSGQAKKDEANANNPTVTTNSDTTNVNLNSDSGTPTKP